jgi:hypothetical protein
MRPWSTDRLAPSVGPGCAAAATLQTKAREVPAAASFHGFLYFAPLSVQEVVQVTVTPCWHFLQTSTHWSIAFGL